jgi:hypothetical protein
MSFQMTRAGSSADHWDAIDRRGIVVVGSGKPRSSIPSWIYAQGKRHAVALGYTWGSCQSEDLTLGL